MSPLFSLLIILSAAPAIHDLNTTEPGGGLAVTFNITALGPLSNLNSISYISKCFALDGLILRLEDYNNIIVALDI